MTSKQKQISDSEFENFVKESFNVQQVLTKMNLRITGSSHRVFWRRVSRLRINVEHFRHNPKNSQTKTVDEIFVENSLSNQTTIRRYVKLFCLIENCCAECGNKGFHNGKSLVLQLDHINGINSDNRLENLRFLCPNCHSQTDTYSNKGKGKERRKMPNVLERHTEEITVLLKEKTKGEICEKFGVGRSYLNSFLKAKGLFFKQRKKRQEEVKIKRVNKTDSLNLEEVLSRLKNESLLQVAKSYGVSDNGLKKFLIRKGCFQSKRKI